MIIVILGVSSKAPARKYTVLHINILVNYQAFVKRYGDLDTLNTCLNPRILIFI